jgi:hypothetical protein
MIESTAFFDLTQYEWFNLDEPIANRKFTCSYCSRDVATTKGCALVKRSAMNQQNPSLENDRVTVGGSYVCPNCKGATFILPDGKCFPAPTLGEPVKSVPDDLYMLYEEARRCTGQKCYTAAVLLCRKMLMNIAVAKGAGEKLSFVSYVDYLATERHIPSDWKTWVDYIRKKGNEATHEIALMEESDTENLLMLTGMLLKIIYEVPTIYQSSISSQPSP